MILPTPHRIFRTALGRAFESLVTPDNIAATVVAMLHQSPTAQIDELAIHPRVQAA
jgi:NADP-dependent 3-hydroxy acid dehydrogenase YdfG